MKHVHAFGDDCLGDLDGVGVARGIVAGEFSATEAVEAALARIDAVFPTGAASGHRYAEAARAALNR